METFDTLLKTLTFHSEGECTDSTAAQAALQHAIGTFVSTVASGKAKELHKFAKQIFVAIPDKRPTPTAAAYVTALEALAITAQRLYERTAPKEEVMHLLEQPQLLKALGALNRRDAVRARDLRRRVGIQYQSNLARLMRKLEQAGLATIYHGEDNSAWYRLTLAGRQLAQEHSGSQPNARLESKEMTRTEVREQGFQVKPDDQRIVDLLLTLANRIRERVAKRELDQVKESEKTALEKLRVLLSSKRPPLTIETPSFHGQIPFLRNPPMSYGLFTFKRVLHPNKKDLPEQSRFLLSNTAQVGISTPYAH